MRSGTIRKCALAAASIAVAALGMVSPATATANTQEVSQESSLDLIPLTRQAEGPYRIKNRQTGRCLESNWSGHTFAAHCSDSIWQGWIWTQNADGWWQVKNWPSKLCLHGIDGRVSTRDCYDTYYQQWRRSTEDAHIAQRVWNSYLDGNHEGSVYLNRWNDGNFQRWDLLWL